MQDTCPSTLEQGSQPQAEMKEQSRTPEAAVSIGILTGNREEFGVTALTSLFKQSLFSELSRRNLSCEIICVMSEQANDATAAVEAVFQAQVNGHEHRTTFSCHMVRLPKPTRADAWNAFVHASSEASAKFLFLIDGDVVIHHPDTLWNMLCTLVEKRETLVVVDEPVKDIAFKPKKTWADKLSLAAAYLALAGGAAVPEQLYGLRAETARSIYVPRDLPAEGRFLAAILTTDYLTRERNPKRIIRVPDAAHTFKAASTLREIFQERKRRMANRTITHVLVDKHLGTLSDQEKKDMGVLLLNNDEAKPSWLKDLVAEHIGQCGCFWRIFPDASSIRMKRLHRLPEMEELRYLPMALADQAATLAACWLAYRSLKRRSRNDLQQAGGTMSHAPVSPGP